MLMHIVMANGWIDSNMSQVKMDKTSDPKYKDKNWVKQRI